MDNVKLLEKLNEQKILFYDEIGKVIIGQSEVIEHILIAMLCRGHILLEGVPGLGKTLIVKTISEVLDLNFSRIQFTPDFLTFPEGAPICLSQYHICKLEYSVSFCSTCWRQRLCRLKS